MSTTSNLDTFRFAYEYDFLETFNRFDDEYKLDYEYNFLETFRFDYEYGFHYKTVWLLSFSSCNVDYELFSNSHR